MAFVSDDDMCFLYGPLLSFAIMWPQHIAFLSTIAQEWQTRRPNESFLMTFLGCVLHLNTRSQGHWGKDVVNLSSNGWKTSSLYQKWNIYCKMLCNRYATKNDCRAFMTTIDELIDTSIANKHVKKHCRIAVCCCKGIAQFRMERAKVSKFFSNLQKRSIPEEYLDEEDLTENENVVFETPQKKKKCEIVYETP